MKGRPRFAYLGINGMILKFSLKKSDMCELGSFGSGWALMNSNDPSGSIPVGHNSWSLEGMCPMGLFSCSVLC
jgi:hypothetical protein